LAEEVALLTDLGNLRIFSFIMDSLRHNDTLFAKNKEGNTPLHVAKTKEIVRLLVSEGGNVNEENNNG
jgi:ankyrin repeat protein